MGSRMRLRWLYSCIVSVLSLRTLPKGVQQAKQATTATPVPLGLS